MDAMEGDIIVDSTPANNEGEMMGKTEVSLSPNKRKKDNDQDNTNSDSDDGDDGVKEGDPILYIGEGDDEGKIMTTNPERRKLFKKERKQRLREIEELREKLQQIKKKSQEKKQERRRAKSRVMEEKFAANEMEEEFYHEFSRLRHHNMMRRYLYHERHDMDFHRDRSEQKSNRDRISRGEYSEKYTSVGGYLSDMSSRSSHHMWRYMEIMEEMHRRGGYRERYGGMPERMRMVEMMMEDTSCSETSDNSEAENVEVEIRKRKLLNMKVEDAKDYLFVRRNLLFRYVLRGDYYTLERYLSIYPDLRNDILLFTALIYTAASQNSTTCLRIMLRQGGRSSRFGSGEKDTPLHIACERNNKLSVQILVSFKAKTEKRDKDGNTPLLIAMHNGACKEIIEALLSKAKLKLHEHANNKGDHLLDKHGPWNGYYRNGESHNIEALRYFFEYAKEKNEDVSGLVNRCNPETGRTPIIEALMVGNLANMKILIENGANINIRLNVPDSRSPTVLHLAAETVNTAAVKLLLENGAAPNALDSIGFSPLRYLLKSHGKKNGDVLDCIVLLAEYGANLNEKLLGNNNQYFYGGDTLLHVVVRFLNFLSQENDVKRDFDGIVDKLFQCGLRANVKNDIGLAPINLVNTTHLLSVFIKLEEESLRTKSLTESCKWVVRGSLGVHSSLSDTARQLPLPKHLIKYIEAIGNDKPVLYTTDTTDEVIEMEQ